MLVQPIHTTRNKHEKLEGKGEASFDNPFMMQSHAERRKLWEPFRIYQLTSTANSLNYGRIGYAS